MSADSTPTLNAPSKISTTDLPQQDQADITNLGTAQVGQTSFGENFQAQPKPPETLPSDYVEYLKAREVQDSPDLRNEYSQTLQASTAANGNLPTAEAYQQQVRNTEAQTVAAQQKYQRDLAEYNAKYSNAAPTQTPSTVMNQDAPNVLKAGTYDNIRESENSGQRISIDLRNVQGDKNAYINSETAKQIAARYNVPESDALEVLNQYPLMKGEGVAYTPEEIAAKETADFKITPDLIEKIRIKTDERNRQERQTVEAEQERQRTETQTAAREAELRQRAIEEIKQENIDNRRIAYDENGMMHDPETGKLLTPTPTEEEIGERVRSIKAAMLDDDSAATARGDAATLNETLGTKSAAIIGGLMGGTAGVNRSIAGLFRSIGFEGGYDAFSKIAQKSQILNDYTGDDGTTTQLLKIGGSLPFDVARIAGMSKLPGGMIVGFAADHKFQAEGAGKNSWEVQKDTAKGGAMGGVFSVAAPIAGKVADTFGKSAISFIDAFPSNAAYKAANIGKAIIKESTEIAVIGHGSYQVSKAFGATDEQARSEMLGNVLFHVANKAGAKAFDKIYKIWNKGEANDVYLDPQGKAKLLKGEVEPNYVDAEIVSDPKSLAYKASENAKRIGGTVENENVGNRGNRIEGNQEAQRSLAAENPRRIDVAQPEAVQKVAVDTRAQKVIENIKDGNTYTAEQVQKATRINAKNLDETLLNLYAAKAIEINPDNSFRFIGGENAATGNKSLFERAGEVEAPKENITLPKSSVENEIVQQIPANGENLVRKDVSSPNEKVPDLSIYEALPQQKTQETQIEKPKARLDYAEPENIAEKLNVFTERGRKASIAPKVVEQSDLLTSLDEGYPPEFQPRDRSRAASKAQISEI